MHHLCLPLPFIVFRLTLFSFTLFFIFSQLSTDSTSVHCQLTSSTSTSTSNYSAAVAQYVPFQGASNSTAAELKTVNLARYAKLTEAAANNGAQLIVFPEFGLGGNMNSRSFTVEAAEYIADITVGINGTIPANQPEKFQDRPVLLLGSQMALSSSVIVVINMLTTQPCNETTKQTVTCGADGRNVYNSNIVFNEKGQILSLYHKSHVWYLFTVDQPSSPDLVTFVSSFGVRFGVFVCMDILYTEPSVTLRKQGIVDFVYSASVGSWGLSLLIQPWSYRNSARIIASNQGAGVSAVFDEHGTQTPCTDVEIDSENAVKICLVTHTL